MKKHKFNAKISFADGIRFQSKAEKNRYLDLKLLQKAHEVVFFIRQVPFDLPGNIVYKADFMVFWANGDITIEDVKGFETAEFKIKKKLLEDTYPIELTLIKVK